MSTAMAPATVGSILTTVEDLDALPVGTIVLGDPEGTHSYEDNRQLALQKRSDGDSPAYWFPSWDTDIFNAIASDEAVERFHLGPFQVLWLPPAG
ncbi:hypothetical protein SEA_ELESAR_36 [Arthrobacter phage Elesar]|uniref:Uncharacterized protein n=1 Tax=Arthrobacter phage Elesar TaxID=2510522 RepID=A0A411CQK9_9CAUD|nr:hypothetical protein QEO79_gp60 [Arthrobacter phage Elesar]QAY16087.1 hypothetical protein SEA_ELESAR_36 [Arthrobacter phage Elesar]